MRFVTLLPKVARAAVVFVALGAAGPSYALNCQQVRQLVSVYFKMHFSHHDFDEELGRRTLACAGLARKIRAEIDHRNAQARAGIDDRVAVGTHRGVSLALHRLPPAWRFRHSAASSLRRPCCVAKERCARSTFAQKSAVLGRASATLRAMTAPASTSASFPVPGLIKRNITLFALSQSFTGAGMQFTYGFGPLMVLALTGTADLAGVSVGLVGLSRFLVAYPTGKITDAFGRKPGILLGLALALVGAGIGMGGRWQRVRGAR